MPPNTTISLGGITARYVRLTIDSTWGGMGVGGLSEVRFYHVPVSARSPQPATTATGVGNRASPKAGGAGLLYLDDILFGHLVK
jgi:hypothetical protein